MVGRAALASLAVLLATPAAAAPDPGVELRAPDEVAAVAGQPVVVSLTLVPATGKSVSTDGPVLVELTLPDGLTASRRRYARRDAADPAAEAPRFELKLRAVAPGEHALRVAVRLWLCGKKVCRPVHAERAVVVRVAPAT
jgi:hypothetical protein